MAYKLATTSAILQACARLHNFIVDQQLLQQTQDEGSNKENDDDEDDDDDKLHIVPHAAAPSGMRYLPTLTQDDYQPMESNSLPQ